MAGIVPTCLANELFPVQFQKEALSLPAGTYFDSKVVDLNGDGNMDLAVLSDEALYILLGDGSGNFSSPTPYNQGGFLSVLAFGDFNGDGFPDAAVANFPGINVLLNDGTGGFPTSVFINKGEEPSGLAVADFNLDGNLDLAVSDFQRARFQFFSEMGTVGSRHQRLSQLEVLRLALSWPILITMACQTWPQQNTAQWTSGFSKA